VTDRQLQLTFARWRDAGQSLVLASVYETLGSTYSKAGAHMLINGDGDFQGMLSGGCLEGDLAERASQVLETGHPQSATYDLGRDDEELWGLGVGCDGLMRIFLQPLHRETGYEPFASMCRAWEGDSIEIAATILESTDKRCPPGSTLVTVGGEVDFCDIDAEQVGAILQQSDVVKVAGRSRTAERETRDGHIKVLVSILKPPPRILVLGGGLDARPLVSLIAGVGWRVVVQDHRPAYIEAGEFGDAEEVICLPADDLVAAIDFSRFDAVVVMSHHLATDRKYLELLATTHIPYIGLLGPPNRRDRLLSDLGDTATSLRQRLHGPAGIDIGANGPASIALSIVAQIHQVLHR
jgi:xanthine/CO dehydrogenase XdhC/CoxF family maturation factor